MTEVRRADGLTPQVPGHGGEPAIDPGSLLS